jgi:hypothetical protein
VSLTVEEASTTYERAMRNPAPAGVGVCGRCHTFVGAGFDLCYRCKTHPSLLAAVVPITYSENLGQMHTVLRNYKDGPEQNRPHAMLRLGAILWRFVEQHEECIAVAAGAAGSGFDLVTTVPSNDPDRDDDRRNLRAIVGEICRPLADRFARILRATGQGHPGHEYDPGRYVATERSDGKDVLLVDDTWTTGGRAQSAAWALREAGARSVALVVIGRHIRPEWEVVQGTGVRNADRLAELPREFSWDTCVVH